MSAPRLEVRLDLLAANAAALVALLGPRGIAVTAVTKATLGSAEVARALLGAGVAGLGESRIENVERLRAAGITAPITLIRGPMLGQVDRVVAAADVSLNTEPAVLAALSAAAEAQGRIHGVLVVVELGDLREGVLPGDVAAVVRGALALPGLEVRGLAANLACQHGVVPDGANMADLSELARTVEADLGIELGTVSGGNSANLDWVLATDDVGRVDDLRLGEAILLGCEPLHRRPLPGLHGDAFTLVGEVVEAKVKPSQPWGTVAESAFGAVAAPYDRGPTLRVLVALGRQDVDPAGLVVRSPADLTVLGASSDHLVLDAGPVAPALVPVGSEVRFGLDYSALLRAATSPFVERAHLTGPADPHG